MLHIRELASGEEARWDKFVEACPQAGFFHRAGWKQAIESAFGHRCHFLYGERDGEITGVLPLTHVKSWLFGKALVSAGFGVGGGPVAGDDETLAALDARAQEMARALGVDHLEYRARTGLHDDWPVKQDFYVNFSRPLSADHDENLKAIPRKQRAMVRKGIKAGLESQLDDDTARLFALYAESVRNLGTPVYSRKWFEALKAAFGADCEILTIVHDGAPVAAVMSFYFRDQVLPYYGGGSLAARPVAGNDFMYWEVMRRAVERGARLFDFGRSKLNTGSFAFKKHWGFEPAPLIYEFFLPRGGQVPEINPLNPKYRLMVDSWKRLPLWLANRLGPLVARDLV